MSAGFSLTTEAEISHWRALSLLSGLALEINTEGKVRAWRLPAITALKRMGIVPDSYRNTQKNRIIILRLLLADYVVQRPGWTPPDTICQAVI